MKSVKIATAQFSLHPRSSAKEFWSDVTNLLARIRDDGAEIVVLPEYACLPLIALRSQADSSHTLGFAEQLNQWAADSALEYQQHWRELASQFKMVIVGGSFPIFDGKSVVNRSVTAFPDGRMASQDKIHMTRFETEGWSMAPGSRSLVSWEYSGLKFVTAICFDVEFPQLSAALAGNPPDVVLVPSCTDSWHGYWRVRHCAAARAIELQSYCVIATCIGGNPAIPDMESHLGKACILGPCDTPFPHTGELATTKTDKQDYVVVELALNALQQLRTNGSVLNLKWHSGAPITIEHLSN
jgi:predicted amidohydrolase